MINPAKASYSIAPTMVVCALGGLLIRVAVQGAYASATPNADAAAWIATRLFGESSPAEPFLAAGYGMFFFGAFVTSRRLEAFLQGALFGAAFVVGTVPTLLANAVNAGSPFSTTYGPNDVVPMDWSFEYRPGISARPAGFSAGSHRGLDDCGSAREERGGRSEGSSHCGGKSCGRSVRINVTHPIFTPYYIIPLAMLSLWSLLFGYLMHDRSVFSIKLAP